MLGKTHLAAAVALSLAISRPDTAAGCFSCLIGASIGGTVSDIDILKSRHTPGVLLSQFLPVVLSIGLLGADFLLKTGLWIGLSSRIPLFLKAGAILYLFLLTAGFFSPHRSFTHSLVGMALFCAAVALLYPPLLAPYFIGYVSHLTLDLLNKKDLALFFPIKHGISLGLCYSDRRADKACFILASVFSYTYVLRLLLLNLGGYLRELLSFLFA